MSRAELIYPIRERIAKELAKTGSDPFNKDILTQYYMVRTTEVSPATVLTELIWLNTFSRMLGKRFEDATTDDMVDLNFRFDQRPNKDSTKNRAKKILKGFYRWLRGCPDGEYPPEVKWIKLKKVPFITVTAEDLIPFDEAVRISEFTKHLRDKAMFQGKVDAGCRIGEILTMKIGEVQFNEHGAIGYSDGKTGYQPIIFTWSAKTLAQWLNIHPFRDNKDAPVFCLLDRAEPIQMSYAAAYRMFKIAVKKAGVSKRVWFHLLKHVSCTEDSKRGMPDSYRKLKHHWAPNSKMSAVYEHLSQSDIPTIQMDTWRRFGGPEAFAKQPEPQATIPLTKKCSRCDYQNPRDSAYCNRCGFSLDGKAAEVVLVRSKIDELMNALAKDPEKLEKLLALVTA